MSRLLRRRSMTAWGLPFSKAPRLPWSTSSRYYQHVNPGSVFRHLHVEMPRTFAQGPPRIHDTIFIGKPLASRLYSQRPSEDRGSDVDEEPAPSQCPPPREEPHPRQSTDPPPLPFQPVNIPGSPPATFSITNNPSLDAALTTVVGLGLGTWLHWFEIRN